MMTSAGLDYVAESILLPDATPNGLKHTRIQSPSGQHTSAHIGAHAAD